MEVGDGRGKAGAKSRDLKQPGGEGGGYHPPDKMLLMHRWCDDEGG